MGCYTGLLLCRLLGPQHYDPWSPPTYICFHKHTSVHSGTCSCIIVPCALTIMLYLLRATCLHLIFIKLFEFFVVDIEHHQDCSLLTTSVRSHTSSSSTSSLPASLSLLYLVPTFYPHHFCTPQLLSSPLDTDI